MRNLKTVIAVAVAAAGVCAVAGAAPRIVVLNPGNAGGWAVTNDGSTVFSGASKFVIPGASSSIALTTLPGTTPAAQFASNDGLFVGGTQNGAASRLDVAGGVWTNVPLTAIGGNLSSVSNVRDLSSTGLYMVGQASFTGTGGFCGYLCDYSVNPPVTRRLLGNTTTARACAVNSDGTVIVGGESPNVSGTTSGGRVGVWRWNAGTMAYDWSYLPDGPANAMGGTIFRTVDQFYINSAGTVIVGNSFKFNDLGDADPSNDRVDSYLTKWVWNAGTMMWDRNDFYHIESVNSISSWWPVPASCPVPPRFFPTAMSDDGNTVVGILEYSTCGSFVRGGFIYTGGVMHDLYDYVKNTVGIPLETLGYAPGVDIFGFGFSRFGFAFDLSDDGQTIVGQTLFNDPDGQGGWIVQINATGGCVDPAITVNPAATTNFTACTGTTFLNTNFMGSPPMTVQWKKDGNNIAAGPSGNGSLYQVLSGTKQLRILPPYSPADAGSYTATVSNACSMATGTSAAGVVQVDPALIATPANDVCSGAATAALGTNVLGGSGQVICSSWNNGSVNPSCTPSSTTFTSNYRTDLWFVFTPGMTQEYRFETCGANYDTIITLYDGCPDMGGMELACNNDRDSGPATHTGSATACSTQRSRIGRYVLTAGVPVYVRIGAAASASLSGTSAANLTIVAAPPIAAGNDCSSPAAAVVGANAFDTNEASGDGFTSCVALTSPAQRDVWFSYTPAFNGLLGVSTCSSATFNTVLTVFTDCFGNELPGACNDNFSGCSSSTSKIENLTVNAGTQYLVRVGGNNATAIGTGTMTLSFAPQGACCVAGACTITTQAGCAGTWGLNDACRSGNLCPCPGDFDGNGVVEVADIFTFLGAWFSQFGSCTVGCSADIDDNVAVEVADIFAFLNQWFSQFGNPCP